MSSSITRTELEEYVEAPAAFTPRAPDGVSVSNERFTLRASISRTWTVVQRIRLRSDEIDDAVDAARSFMRVTGSTIAGWWLSERSTPDDLEAQLLARGLKIVANNYRIEGMATTSAPPEGPPDVIARRVETADEFVAATQAQYEAFGTPDDRRRDVSQLVDQFGLQGDTDATYAAWLDGRIVGGGRSEFSPRGVLMVGGATVPEARGRGVYRALVRARWHDAEARGTPVVAVHAGAMSAPILRGLGFEKIVEFRRLEDVG